MTRPLARLGLALGLALSPACGDAGGASPPSAVLLTLDTTRADALGAYRPNYSVTPNLDALAAESLVFDAAHTVAPLTLPAHTSMLTGLYPPRHTVRDNGYRPVPDSAVTLAELAREAGLQTAAFVAAVVLESSFGLDQGFEVYDGPRHADAADPSHPENRRAREVVDRALAWLAARDPDRGYFLWVHLFDPHSPYEPPFDLRKQETPAALYRAEVAGMDRELGRLFDGLRADPAYERTTILVVADHGESLEEHGEPTHSAFCYEAVLRVPFFLRLPGGERGGERSDVIASVVDVYPTLAAALGLRPAPDQDGLNLLEPSAVPADRGVYFESYTGYLAYGWSPLAGWLDRRGKLIASSEPSFFDWRADPHENHDLLAAGRADVTPYRAGLEAVLARPTLPAADGDTSAEMLAAIRSLGYAGVAPAETELPGPFDEPHLPAPKGRAAELRNVMLARQLGVDGRLEEAARLFAPIVADNPGNVFALEHYADVLVRLERYADALPVLERLVASGRARAFDHYALGGCLWIAGRREESLAAIRRATELEPSNPLYLEKLAALLKAEGRGREARPYLERLRALRSGDD